MNTYELVQRLTDLKTKEIKRKRLEFRERTNSLIKRQRNLLDQNGGSDTNLSSTINLNVGGKKMVISRALLTCIKGSRLEVLISGRFENKLLRDNEGNIFLDIDSDLFMRGIESLCLIKISNNSNNKLTLKNFHKDNKDLELLVKFLSKVSEQSIEEEFSFEDGQLLDETTLHINGACNDSAWSIITKEEKLSIVIENKLKSIEEKLNTEESLIEFFVRSPLKNDDGYNSITNNIVTLEFLSGERISVKHSTLCLDENSLFAKQFNNEEWINTHKSKEKDSDGVIITEQSGYFFKKMINRLRLRAILDPGYKLSRISVKNVDEKEHFHKFLSNWFPGNECFIIGDEPIFDSIILKTSEESNTILSWLPPVHKTPIPKLLYRATRDGWDASIYHSKCDNNGSSITVIKTDKGYVFGGYLDKDWNRNGHHIASTEAFIFSLKCHANLPPTKMINKNSTYAALGHFGFGPVFDGETGISIASNSNASKSSSSNINNCVFQRPDDVSDPFFLNGQKHFKVSEIEVYQV